MDRSKLVNTSHDSVMRKEVVSIEVVQSLASAVVVDHCGVRFTP